MKDAQQPVQHARWDDRLSHTHGPKPLLRGWLHAVAAVGAVGTTMGMVIRTYDQPRQLIALLLFGLSMISLYSVSALYHLGRWQGRRAVLIHTLDRANIFVYIAGTYTPFCLLALDQSWGMTLLALEWGLAAIGIGSAILTIRAPRWFSTALYLGMGWLVVIASPALIHVLPLPALILVVAGGILYSMGAVVYARRRPDPWPHIFGFHEVFHLFVVAGSAAFLIAIWGWVVPYAAR
jgi:hemolysin III